MNYIKLIIIGVFLSFHINVFAQAKNTLIIKSHHPNDKNTIIRIWKTPKNNYIIRTSYSDETDDFDQEKIYQFQKKVEYDGFSKRVAFNTSDESFYIIAQVNGEYILIYGFYSEALKNIVSISYITDYIDQNVFNEL